MDLLVQAKALPGESKMFVRNYKKDSTGEQKFIELLTKETLKKPIEVIKATKTVNGRSVKCSVAEALAHFNAGGTINVYVDGASYARQG